MTAPYWEGDGIQLFHGDCREVTEWLAADVLVTDPPYGRKWAQGFKYHKNGRHALDDNREGIAGDEDTTVRDTALAVWGDRLSMVFGHLVLAPPARTRQTLVYLKAPNSGTRGTMAGFRRDAEAIYLTGPWRGGLGGRSSVIRSGARAQGAAITGRYGHRHAKPVDVMETLIAACPPGVVADPFAGSGSTLVAARNQGRRAIGIEIDERYCGAAARRLDQGILLEASHD